MNDFIVSHYQIKGKRSYQEDRCYSASDEVGENQLSLLVVADGMGGHAGGDIAAGIAIDEVKDWWNSLLSKPLIIHWSKIKDELEAVFLRANRKIKKTVDEGKGAHGMGTTLICALIINGKAIIANIGDSRAYISNKFKTSQVTKDHSAVQEALDRGIDISQSNIGHNAITRCLDGSEPCLPDVYPFEKDFYEVSEKAIILSSDGFHGVLDEQSINDIITAPLPFQERLWRATDTALDYGSTDNISIAAAIPKSWEKSVFSTPKTFDISDSTKKYEPNDKWILAAVVLLCFAFVGIAGTLAWREGVIDKLIPNSQENETLESDHGNDDSNSDPYNLELPNNTSNVELSNSNYVTVIRHKVISGQTLEKIAREHPDVTVSQLIEFNFWIDNANAIREGQIILIPVVYHDLGDRNSFAAIYTKHKEKKQERDNTIKKLEREKDSSNSRFSKLKELYENLKTTNENLNDDNEELRHNLSFGIKIDKKNTGINLSEKDITFTYMIENKITHRIYNDEECKNFIGIHEFKGLNLDSSEIRNIINDHSKDTDNDQFYIGTEIKDSGLAIFCKGIPDVWLTKTETEENNDQ